MATCREVTTRALRSLKAIAPGESPHIDQITAAITAIQDLILELHEARGPLRDVDVPNTLPPPASFTGGWVANENTRVRIQAGQSVVVTLPNSVSIVPGWNPYDYEFVGWPMQDVQGSTGAADNIAWRQPSDGARIEIVGVTSQLFFYCADVNQWVSAGALRLDDALPLNSRYAGAFATVLAERLSEELALNEPSPGFTRRVAQARALLLTRPGIVRRPVPMEAF